MTEQERQDKKEIKTILIEQLTVDMMALKQRILHIAKYNPSIHTVLDNQLAYMAEVLKTECERLIDHLGGTVAR